MIGPFLGIRAARRARAVKDWATAAQCYGAVLKSSPNHPKVWVQYGHALKESGDRPAAERAYREALKQAPDVADTYVQLGHVTKLMGRSLEAATHYRRALELKPDRRDAALEIEGLESRSVELGGFDLLNTPTRSGDARVALPSVGLNIAFDVSDLLNFFQMSRHPSGIQRLQIEIMTAIHQAPTDATLVICRYSAPAGGWLEVSAPEFVRLCGLATSVASTEEWNSAKAALDALVVKQTRMAFSIGAFLVVLGTSWTLPNYFLHLRAEQRASNLVYVPMVYDLIPILTPENFVLGLVRDFVGWILGVFHHTEYFLAISEATKTDLLKIARSLGQRPRDVAVIPLDADFRKPASAASDTDGRVRSELGLGADPYILFVSTIEPRKNHVLAFSAWLRLIRKRGIENTPRLVCVGGAGWLNEATLSKLKSSDLLRRKVTLLTGLSDNDLAALYRGSEFTIYPSLYEGWGLPITESLCHGKLPLVARTSSLPEAGGDFAEYFEPQSEADFIAQLERLIDDTAYRATRERHIREDFQPRSWSDIAAQLIATLAEWRTDIEASNMILPRGYLEHCASTDFQLKLGGLYRMRQNLATEIQPGMITGEPLRDGENWWAPEEWGCWTKPGRAYLSFSVPATETPLRGYLGLKGLPSRGCAFTVEIASLPPITGALSAAASRWVPFILPKRPAAEIMRIMLTSDMSEDLSANSEGHDRRAVSLGMIGLMLCQDSDMRSRMNLMEALHFNDLSLTE